MNLRFANNSTRIFVITQPDEFGVAQVVGAGPLGEI